MATNPEPTDSIDGLPSPSQISRPAGIRSRRRFMGAAAGSVGVFLAVQARSALGQVSCQSPSALVSGNLSHQPVPQVCSGGLSPTDWKLKDTLLLWGSVGVSPPTFTTALEDSLGCNNGHVISDPKSVMSNAGTLVDTILPGAVANTGIWEILAFPSLFSSGELMSHLIAAWLNATLHADYPIRQSHVSDMWTAMQGSGPYCPASLVCSDSSGMGEADIIAYIKNTYSLNSDLIAVCEVNGSSTASQGNTGNTTPKK
ncbi:hypothetical protein [Aromatoleum diolicum]|uniref:Uncharacterized protein n=1 Tax=Aromatoleum diolicum TaxID=75796 RepID=A0ABX1Q4E2_9RHOO|nr:hypothetical protein [Aromatoleum diolicum]NMG73222.1 hypothetical protein [Aromatoleum diolicum]